MGAGPMVLPRGVGGEKPPTRKPPKQETVKTSETAEGMIPVYFLSSEGVSPVWDLMIRQK